MSKQCAICERKIGMFEAEYMFFNHVVCKECSIALENARNYDNQEARGFVETVIRNPKIDQSIKDSLLKANCAICGRDIYRSDGTRFLGKFDVCVDCNKRINSIKEEGGEATKNFVEKVCNEERIPQEIKEKLILLQKEKNHYDEVIMKHSEFIQNMIVTTGDLKEDYTVIGPVYFQTSNKGLFGSSLSELIRKYEYEIEIMKGKGMVSPSRADWGFIYGEWSVGQNLFEKAFYVSTQELKKRAAILGADAIIGMRQDIDMDTTGFQYFYLQMYGTAVRFEKKEEECNPNN